MRTIRFTRYASLALLLGLASAACAESYPAKPPFNLLRDFAPVMLWATATFYLLAHPSVAAKSVSELIKQAGIQPE